jgi:hypothetical protein
VSQARAKFPAGPGFCEHNLVLSHRRRIWLNARMNLALKPGTAVLVRKVSALGATSAPQDMWVYAGQSLVACCNNGTKGLRNGVRYVVKHVGEQILLEGGTTLTHAQCVQLLRLSHAQTYASCQGDEFNAVRLWDVENRHFTWRHLYVGLSRSKGKAEII